ncbi:hypothetical protein [Prauserella flavalba]|uniref:hypothetical protein n=1 Tax=Prauserella flavalba TaxID=1477506 RepID=UPI0036EC9339
MTICVVACRYDPMITGSGPNKDRFDKLGARVAQRFPTLSEVRQWPATVDVVTAGKALGLGRNASYDAVRQGEFPVRVIKIGHRYRVVTSELVSLLDTASEAVA